MAAKRETMTTRLCLWSAVAALALVCAASARAQELVLSPETLAEAFARPAGSAPAGPALTADAPPRPEHNAAAVARRFPSDQQADLRTVLRQNLALYQKLEAKYGWPRNDVAGALAVYLVGSHIGMSGAAVLDEHIGAVAAQLRASPALRAALVRQDAQALRDSYEQQAMVGTFLILAQSTLQQRPLPAEQLALLRRLARENLQLALGRDPAQLSIGPAGLTLPAAPAPAPVAARAPAPSGGPSGRLWHNHYPLDSLDGAQLARLDGGASTQITRVRELEVGVWPDGSQYLVADARRAFSRGHTSLAVIDLATGRTVYQQQLAGYARDFAPSPTDKRLVKLTQGKSTLPPAQEYVLDLSTMQRRLSISDDDHFGWMPDGSYLLISLRTGSMRIGSLGGTAERVVGRLQLPPDRRMGPFLVSPNGRQFIMSMDRRGGVPRETDLWIGNIDGSGFEQLTDAKAIGGAAWSPDGRYVTYKVDTGLACGGRFCAGTCSQYYTPAELRKVQGLDRTPGSAVFKVRNRFGSAENLGCSVFAWTP